MIMSTGKWWRPFERDSSLVWKDVARGLLDKQRFGGMLPLKWSVLHHTVALYYIARRAYPEGSPNFFLSLLVHDAHEFLLGDVPMPLKTDARRHEEKMMQMALELALGIWEFTNLEPEDERILKAFDRLETEREGRLFMTHADPELVSAHFYGDGSDIAIEDGIRFVRSNYPNTPRGDWGLLCHWMGLVNLELSFIDGNHEPKIV